jgi:hypothetical protein
MVQHFQVVFRFNNSPPVAPFGRRTDVVFKLRGYRTCIISPRGVYPRCIHALWKEKALWVSCSCAESIAGGHDSHLAEVPKQMPMSSRRYLKWGTYYQCAAVSRWVLPITKVTAKEVTIRVSNRSRGIPNTHHKYTVSRLSTSVHFGSAHAVCLPIQNGGLPSITLPSFFQAFLSEGE